MADYNLLIKQREVRKYEFRTKFTIFKKDE